MTYRGRFAPSPTGELHFGSLVTATASYLEARCHGGQWLLRLEDVDQERCSNAAGTQILRTLETFGFVWDGPVWRQSERSDSYLAVLEQLAAQGLLYACSCTRKQIAARAQYLAADGSAVYPGTCRPPARNPASLAELGAGSWRLRVAGEQRISFDDLLQGRRSQCLDTEVGDFVLRRADGLFAYQLAVVVDDAAQGVNAVVRGADLLGSTARQIYLQQCLGYPRPSYAHLPLATDAYGKKWSKQRLAPALLPDEAGSLLWHALRFLGQHIPPELERAPLAAIWEWAQAHWSLQLVPHCTALRTPLVVARML